MKKLKPIDEAWELALCALELAAEQWLKIRAVPADKPLPKKLVKEYTKYAGLACRYWRQYKDLGAEEFLKSYKPFEDMWIGKVKTGKFPNSK